MRTALAPQRAGVGPAAGLRAAPALPLRARRSARAAVRPQAISRADDEIKEQSRKFRRNVYTFEDWERHRSSGRYSRHLMTMFTSRVIWGLKSPLLYVAAVSTGVVVYEALRQQGLLPEGTPSLQLASKEPFALTSFALSLLLVFRTNSSYERWDGARKMWGLLLNRSRDFVRIGLTYIPEEKEELRAMLARWTPAFARALLCHLRKDGDWQGQLGLCLRPDEIEQVLKATHRPNYVLQVLSEIVREGNVGIAATERMDQNLTQFEDVLGGCERILKTPIPLSYTRHTSRFLMIWLTLLPFSLVGGVGAGTVPLCVIIAFLLLGIEEIGVSIEEPFSILALEAISDSAMNNSRELLAQHSLPGIADGPTKKPAGQSTAKELIRINAEGKGLAVEAPTYPTNMVPPRREGEAPLPAGAAGVGGTPPPRQKWREVVAASSAAGAGGGAAAAAAAGGRPPSRGYGLIKFH